MVRGGLFGRNMQCNTWLARGGLVGAAHRSTDCQSVGAADAAPRRVSNPSYDAPRSTIASQRSLRSDRGSCRARTERPPLPYPSEPLRGQGPAESVFLQLLAERGPLFCLVCGREVEGGVERADERLEVFDLQQHIPELLVQ